MSVSRRPETLQRLFRTLFGPRGRKASGDSLETLLGLRAKRARETPVRSHAGVATLALIKSKQKIQKSSALRSLLGCS